MRTFIRVITAIGQAVTVFGLNAYHSANIAQYSYAIRGTSRQSWDLTYIALLIITSYLVGLPDRPKNAKQAVAMSLVATLLGVVLISALQFVLGSTLLPRFVVFGTAAINVLLLAFMAWVHSGRAFGTGVDRVVVLASEQELARLQEDLLLEQERPFQVTAAIPISSGHPGDNADDAAERVRSSLPRSDSYDVLVLDVRAQGEPAVVRLAAQIHESGTRVRTLQDFYAEWLGKLPVSELQRQSLLFDIREIHNPSYAYVKRAVDIVISAIGMVLLIFLIPIIAFINLFANRGPLFFKQSRIGKGGQIFTIWKFRTMTDKMPARSDEPGHEHQWTTENDPRITPFGKFLRKTHLDELPQMFNILKGDLSVVGPRPEQEHYVNELSERLPFYNLRHLVRPGLTGWAQVKYGYAGDERDALEKLQYEFFYLERQDLGFDISIMLRTFRSMTGGAGSGR